MRLPVLVTLSTYRPHPGAALATPARSAAISACSCALASTSASARGAHLAAMKQDGLKLLISDQERVVHPRCCTDNPAELGIQDFIIICQKANRRARTSAASDRAAHPGGNSGKTTFLNSTCTSTDEIPNLAEFQGLSGLD